MQQKVNSPRYLAFLDILGFKDLIENNDLSYLEKLYDKFEPSLLFTFAFTNLGYRVKHLDSNQLPPVEETHLNSIIISDSIIIWTDGVDQNSFISIISAVRHQLFLSMQLGLPLRGFITMGDLSIRWGKHEKSTKINSYTTILGKALTTAYVMQGKLNSMGCIVDDDCISQFKKNTLPKNEDGTTPLSIESLQEFIFLKKYTPPMKNSKVAEKYVVNWTHYFGPRLTEKEVREAFSAHNKICDSWDVEEKILNTLKFLKDTGDDYNEFRASLKSKKI